MKVPLIASFVAVALGVFLAWRGPAITKNAYKAAFFIGLATFAAFLFGRAEWGLRLGRGPLAVAALIPIAIFASTPFLLILETGIAGWRGFSSWIRYLSAAIAALGAVGLIASFALPWLERRSR